MNHFAIHWKLIQHCKSTILQYTIKIKFKKIIIYLEWNLTLERLGLNPYSSTY